ncbi:hypothetical protein APS56_06945 [Pseudalgibacter alginicilyticus]|uniref:Uncharacterized protein n=1 Tax=Pseudalgibacter alginicilyticus TaxID=1736674 RepID=A0A0P0DA52_9FLAO|nr:hypothetical protein [Pseudalgibacter alginicilyticus]ALJ04872.1 hypothetical protein APS56_06945 [Pseudalgibacter alginicilyticus]
MKLKTVLLINALSSGATGILLTFIPQFFTDVFKVKVTTPFLGTGIFLILFSSFVFVSALSKPIKISWVRAIIFMDSIWVIASVICVAVLYSSISNWGSFLIIGVALWVSIMAYLQKKYLKQI